MGRLKDYNLENFVISENATIGQALAMIELNTLGFVLTANAGNVLIGLASDGDIRRGLIKGFTIDEPISRCANVNFLSAKLDTPREHLIKSLDGHIRFIPILDELGKLQSVVSKDYFPLEEEKSIYVRSRAPVRVSFGGGGSDVTHYFANSSGAVINSAISIYSHATMRVRADSRIVINSLDFGTKLVAENLDDALSKEGPFGLIQSLLHVVQPQYGFELSLNSDFAVGSGLGGSATISAVVLGCFNELRKDQWSQYELAEIAFQAERLHLGIAGGWQDQYAAVFGGFNFIEFNADENIVNPIRVHSDIALELEESLILCNTGIKHHSGDIHENQKEMMTSESVRNLVNTNVELTYSTRKYLLRGELTKFGESLNASWQLKRNFSSMISNQQLDAIYNGAIQNGALGGKLLGAGGGGYFIFYVPPFEKHNLMTYLISQNLAIQPFRFEPDGLKTWTSRDNKNNSIKESK
jgi:D-glycero-alpha-D-manno-heptose-7-phosphate kinase